jgi:hypothetical protein
MSMTLAWSHLSTHGVCPCHVDPGLTHVGMLVHVDDLHTVADNVVQV